MVTDDRPTMGKKLRFSVLSRDAYACRYCGARAPDVKLHVDHVIPRIIGGPTSIENLATSCQDCNLGKGASAPSTILPVPVIEPVPVSFRPRRPAPLSVVQAVDDIAAPAPQPTRLPQHPLVGCAFLSFTADGTPNWQAEITSVFNRRDVLMVGAELYSWVDGEVNGSVEIPVTDFIGGAADGATYRLFVSPEERNRFYAATFEEPEREALRAERVARSAARQAQQQEDGEL